MNTITQLVVMTCLVEAIWETLKMTWQEGKLSGDRLGALIVGLVLAFTVNLDMLNIVGLTSQQSYFGIASSGVLASRGSNFIHDFMSNLQKVGDKNE